MKPPSRAVFGPEKPLPADKSGSGRHCGFLARMDGANRIAAAAGGSCHRQPVNGGGSREDCESRHKIAAVTYPHGETRIKKIAAFGKRADDVVQRPIGICSQRFD